jgi:hypothetical protein
MPNPRYVPRLLSLEPLDFGQKAGLLWRDEDDLRADEVDYLGAAKLQHEFALLVSERIRRRFNSLTDYASFAGVNYPRLARILRGDVILRLEDVASAQRVLQFRLDLRTPVA